MTIIFDPRWVKILSLAVILGGLAGLNAGSALGQEQSAGKGHHHHALTPAHVQEAVSHVVNEGAQRLFQWEFMRMFHAILSGSRMGPREGWFGPGSSRYDWNWLVNNYDADGDGEISPAELGKARNYFQRLDRDGDGMVTREDLDWSGKSRFLQMQAQAGRLFSMVDNNSNGRISQEEWAKLFDKLSKGKDHLTPADVQRLISPPTATARSKTPPKKGGGGPPTKILVKGLFMGELGSPFHGPKVGDMAPDFTLNTMEGKEKITLSQFRGHKPVVLIFGSFT